MLVIGVDVVVGALLALRVGEVRSLVVDEVCEFSGNADGVIDWMLEVRLVR